MLLTQVVYAVGCFSIISAFAENSTFLQPENVTSPLILSTTTYYIPVYSVEYDILEDKLPKLLFDLMQQYPFSTYVNTEDILVLQCVDKYIVPPKLIDLNLDRIFDIANMSINEILRNLTVHVPSKRMTNIIKILEGFNIDFSEYHECVFGNNDVDMHQLLKKGNYTDETIQYALNIMNQTEEQMVTIIKPILYSGLANVPLPKFLNIYHDELVQIFSNINTALFNKSECEAFKILLKNFTDTLKNETIWSIAVSTNELITLFEATHWIHSFREYIEIHVRNIENPNIFSKGNITTDGTISVITVKENFQSFIEWATDYLENISECYYLSQTTTGNILVHNITTAVFQSNMILTENKDEAIHTLGSPLICKDLLYGLLVDFDKVNLKFLRLNPKNVGKPISIEPDNFITAQADDHEESGTVNKLTSNLFLVSVLLSTKLLIL